MPKQPIVELNERQQAYLRLIYQQDKQQADFAKFCWFRGRDPGPASEWRWIPYNTNSLGLNPDYNSELKASLKAENLVDSGTGATFVALQERGMVELRHRKKALTQYTDIKLTRKGRALCRRLWPEQC